MKLKRIPAIFLSAILTFSITDIQTPNIKASDEYTLVWSDEFDGDSLNTDNWSYELGNWKLDDNGNFITNGWGNNEQEFYTDKNASVSDGILTIAARHENYSDAVQGNYEYTSARLSTQYKFSTCGGRIEVRSRCDSGKSLWPAIWMLPEDSAYGGWAASGEIDIMEGWGSTPDKICGTIHFGDVWPNNTYLTNNFNFENGDSTENWHTYAVDWDRDSMRWYVDDILYSTQTDWYSVNRPSPAPFDQNFYLILNLAVGGHFDGVDGIYGEPAAFANGEKHLDIDYVRVYKKKGSDFQPTPITSEALGSYIEGASASLTNKNGYSEFDIKNVGTLEYAVLGLLTARKVEAGQKYRLSFGISSTAEREAVITAENNTYTRYLDEKILIAPEKKYYSFDVTFDEAMSVDLKFQLGNIGNSASVGEHKVTISDIKWERITDSILGDVNEDNSLSVADLVTLQKWLIGDNEVKINTDGSDICKDDRIDSFDLSLLRKMLIGGNEL